MRAWGLGTVAGEPPLPGPRAPSSVLFSCPALVKLGHLENPEESCPLGPCPLVEVVTSHTAEAVASAEESHFREES